MIHLLNWIFKGLLTLIVIGPIGSLLLICALCMWNKQFLELAGDVMETVWSKLKS